MMHCIAVLLFAAITANAKAWPSQNYRTEKFSPPRLKVVGKPSDTSGGYIIFGPTGSGISSPAPLIMERNGDLIWNGPVSNPQNVRVQSLYSSSGKTSQVITYWDGYGATPKTFGHGLGSVRILDNTYKELYKICPKLDLYYVNLQQMPCMLDYHESFLTNASTIVVTAYNVTRWDLTSVGGPKNGWIFDSLFYEIDIVTQEVVFQWSSLANIKTFPLNKSARPLTVNGVKYGSSSAQPWDYFGINSVQPAGGGYLVGSSFYSSVLAVFPSKIGFVLAGSDGGHFVLAPGTNFAYPNMPRVVNGSSSSILTLTLLNNNNSNAGLGKNATTGLSVKINLNDHTVSLISTLEDVNDPIADVSGGSYQTLGDGSALLGYGSVPVFKEFDSKGRLQYTAQFGRLGANASAMQSYRVYRQHWTGNPVDRPKVVAENAGGFTHVHVSWNGATGINHYVVYAGGSPMALKRVMSFPKAGFETTQSLHAAYAYVQVFASRPHASSRNSTIVKVS